MSVLPSDTLATIRESAGGGQWPSAGFETLRGTDALRWSIPVEYGGRPVDDRTFLAAYIELAEADLALCFVLTQRNGACQRIAGSANGRAKEELLPGLAAGERFATVGISHLTTSRQHTDPAMRVARDGEGFRLDGFCPWATSATRADTLVTGGQLTDGTQVLVAADGHADGVRPGEPMSLLALSESETGAVTLDGVWVGSDRMLAGPVEAVMRQGKGGGAGSLTTSALAIGLARRAAGLLQSESASRDDLTEAVEALVGSVESLRTELLEAVADGGSSADSLRTRANSLALRATQALLTATKGAGFVVGHPAERAVREAMFFLVWSCPRPVAAAAMQQFACSDT